MNRSSDFPKGTIVCGLVKEEPEFQEPKLPREYMNAMAQALKYLATYSANGQDIEKMGKEERRRYVVGYTIPFLRAGVPSEVFWRLGLSNGGSPGEALLRWMERPGPGFFPRKPGELLEICKVVMKDRAPGWKPPEALPTPPPSRDLRNEQRLRLGIDPLPDESELKSGRCGCERPQNEGERPKVQNGGLAHGSTMREQDIALQEAG